MFQGETYHFPAGREGKGKKSREEISREKQARHKSHTSLLLTFQVTWPQPAAKEAGKYNF